MMSLQEPAYRIRSSIPQERVIEALDAAGIEWKRSGQRIMCCCPVHDDNNPSLSFKTQPDGKVSVKCFVGCEVADILKAIGLEFRDLYVGNGSEWRTPRPPPTQQKQPKEEKQYTTAYATWQGVLASYRRTFGMKESGIWPYHNADGVIVQYVVRFDPPNRKKQYPSIGLIDGKWYPCGTTPLRPLYRLLEVRKANAVWVLEGEKCADLVRTLGLAATTASNGAMAPAMTDWSPLAGKEVYLIADNNEVGRKYIAQVKSLLAQLEPLPIAFEVELLHLQPDQDIEQWLDALDGKDDVEIRTMLGAKDGAS